MEQYGLVQRGGVDDHIDAAQALAHEIAVRHRTDVRRPRGVQEIEPGRLMSALP